MEFFFFFFLVRPYLGKKSAGGFEIGRGGKPAGAAATQGSLFLTNKPPPTMKPPFAESGYWKRHRDAYAQPTPADLRNQQLSRG